MQTASKKVINGWAMFDWANSVYNLVITTTFFPIYFTSATKAAFKSEQISFLGRKFENSALYDYTLGVAYFIIALSYPILTSIADIKGNKKNFTRFFTYMGSIGCSGLFLFQGENVGYGIVCFMLAAMGYVGSLVFYNAYLPELAAPEDRDRISAKGYTYGYIGSVLLQIIGFALVIIMSENQGLASRITFLLVGLWWFGFAQITFSRLPSGQASAHKKGASIFTEGFSEMKKIYQQVKLMPVLKRYLRGFFFYSMGVQTVMLAATLFGSKLLHLDDTKLIITVVIIQLVAIIGAIMMSKLSSKFGNLKVLMGVVLFWILICVAAFTIAGKAEPLKVYFDKIDVIKNEETTLKDADASLTANSPVIKEKEAAMEVIKKEVAPLQAPIEYGFYGLAVAVGLVMGGIQSLSRSTYSKLMPETTDTASYFSYYDLTEKIAIVIGMFSFGFIEELTGSMKNSVLSLIIFFGLGLVWLLAASSKQKQLSTQA
ncbi:MFS transporter [Ferruginibacter sp.]